MSEAFNLHRERGWEFYKADKFEEALAEWQDASRLDPEDSYVRNSIVNALAQLGRSGEALTAVRAAIRLDPKDAGLYHSLGYCLRVQADKTQDQAGWKDAAAAFQRAIDIDPASSYAYHALAGMHWRLKRKREAVSGLRTAVSLNPNDLEALFALGTAQIRTGDFRGVAQTTRAINSFPNSEEVKEYLADKDRNRRCCIFLLSLGTGLAAILVGGWIWRRSDWELRGRKDCHGVKNPGFKAGALTMSIPWQSLRLLGIGHKNRPDDSHQAVFCQTVCMVRGYIVGLGAMPCIMPFIGALRV